MMKTIGVTCIRVETMCRLQNFILFSTV